MLFRIKKIYLEFIRKNLNYASFLNAFRLLKQILVVDFNLKFGIKPSLEKCSIIFGDDSILLFLVDNNIHDFLIISLHFSIDDLLASNRLDQSGRQFSQ